MNTKTHVSRISIGRVYNLGNYEHVRFEITIDVGEGDSAANALKSLENIIADLKPIGSEKMAKWNINRKQREIDTMKASTDEEWKRFHGAAVGTREEVTKRYVEDLAKDMRDRAASIVRRHSAQQALDHLGGSGIYTDSEEQWKDEE